MTGILAVTPASTSCEDTYITLVTGPTATNGFAKLIYGTSPWLTRGLIPLTLLGVVSFTPRLCALATKTLSSVVIPFAQCTAQAKGNRDEI